MSEARVKVLLVNGGTMEIEGTESFVSAQLEKFGAAFRSGLGVEDEAPPAPAAEPPAPVVEEPAAPVEAPAVDTFEDIFAATDTGVRILTDIPGYRVHEKMPNVAKLLAFGIALLKNRTVVRFDEVTAECKSHRCYDGTHMASALKLQKRAFEFGGRRKRQTLTLTASGTSDAEKLIEKIRAAGSPLPKAK